MKTIFAAKVVEVGAEVQLFLEEKMMVLFDQTAPADLRDIAVVHQGGVLREEIEAGDELVINGEGYRIHFVGSKANQTIRELGHATIAFNGMDNSDMPGTICVEDKLLPTIDISAEILFRKRNGS
ncbi:PTS glucitol/sorbitol transporter subunit IIA [Brevibacillus fulvus]|uniref:PTS system glucitol/sorbitol-specific IIA component n=1 Tax=Brevibacillus fulvus TaxID=1125967 RepID=A0A939BWD2_9BACL|nr:PTS glucitol/sorbitol transporter subunit IIA [Brevibacillus fulvus]MBM7591691.1 PTS system glucitol/sorbitol-specific IIA component [Brevibacillus fulvus]